MERSCPGDADRRQPVHTVYGGAHLFRSDVAQKLGSIALDVMKHSAPDAGAFRDIIGLPDSAPAEQVYDRVLQKLMREPVEDYRIDFEDGYGIRSDEEEDAHASSAADQISLGTAQGTLPASIGIRIKPLTPTSHRRGRRTLDVFMTALARNLHEQSLTQLTQVIVTVPKVMVPAQVKVVAECCRLLERRLKLGQKFIRIELMVETPQSIIAPNGSTALRKLVAAGDGRVSSVHFGMYDYTALLGIAASQQQMDHPSCRFARQMMQVSLAQTGVRCSDAATNILPIGDHATIHNAWRRHFHDVMSSLSFGFYQGWDLHPAQLPTRYAAVYSFYLSAYADAATRLRKFVNGSARARAEGDKFDDLATARALRNFFVRGLNAGAFTLSEVQAAGLAGPQLEIAV